MLFNSHIFCFIFLPFVVIAHKFLRYRNSFLLLMSLFFYLWSEPGSGFLILCGLVLLNFFIAKFLDFFDKKEPRRALFWVIIILNVGTLLIYKYLDWKIPLGLSFYTLSLLSYNIDVYQKKISAEKNLLDFSLYITIFPHLFAGPIIRYSEIRDQVKHSDIAISFSKIELGLERFIIGLAKKVLIADILAKSVDPIFLLEQSKLSTPIAWLGSALFALQIYYDFSGYTDMAIGIAQMLGYKFPENFNQPYLSRNLTEFWRRWHITFANWMRDYLFTPFSVHFRHFGKISLFIALLLSFALSGLWHGAALTYIVWGLYHGFWLIMESGRWGRFLTMLPSVLQRLYFFLVILIGYVFFRSPSFSTSLLFLSKMLIMPTWKSQAPFSLLVLNPLTAFTIFIAIFICLPRERFIRKFKFIDGIGFKAILRPVAYFSLFILTLCEVVNITHHSFIYFHY